MRCLEIHATREVVGYNFTFVDGDACSGEAQTQHISAGV